MEHALRPASVGVRGQLEDDADVIVAAPVRRTIELTRAVNDQWAERGIFAVVAVERMEHALRPASVGVRGQLEDISGVCARCRAIEVTGAVEDEAGKRPGIRTAGKTVENALAPVPFGVRAQLEDRSEAISAALGRRAIEVSGCVEDQAAKRQGPIRAACKTVENTLAPVPVGVRSQFENRAVIHTTALGGHAIETTCAVKDQAAKRRSSVLATLKRMQRFVLAGRPSAGR